MAEPRRLNIGSGGYRPRRDVWLNLDADPAVAPDVCATVPPIPYGDATVTEIYLGHCLEHFDYPDGQALLRECARVLVPGGRLGVVVPDTRAIMHEYLHQTATRVEVPERQYWALADLDDVCAVFLYGVTQPSHHQWSYDADTLRRALERAGLEVTAPIDTYHDPRLSNGGTYWAPLQCGWDARRREV